MNQDYIIPNEWSIIEEGFNRDRIKSSESLFSIGNGAMGQRANFEEDYSGATFQGSYIAGVYYPDKTRVGWWKNGYPEYFAKVLNAPNWIGIHVEINDERFDLANCTEVKNFRRELNMKEGWLARTCEATLENGIEVRLESKRFLSLDLDELGVVDYQITLLNSDATIHYIPYLDAGITNEDSNWDDQFWKVTNISSENERAFIEAHTMKTHFHTCVFMESLLFQNGQKIKITPTLEQSDLKIGFRYSKAIQKNETLSIQKYGGYTADRNHKSSDLVKAAGSVLDKAINFGFHDLLELQKQSWNKIWEMADIAIVGDVKAQQGIRFNIFQLNQTYLGTDAKLNIGPKGFTGEKYGGSTYWDTEAYCIPFYMTTKDATVARNLLEYRFNHLDKAIENAERLGFNSGAALFPMVTMNGEECHNEWEITFEEIHRNAAISFAIFNYVRYTGDQSYIAEKGLEVLIGVARFWKQRATFSKAKNQYVILGVTGPNEYENNVNNNWYTNYAAQWCINYAIECVEEIASEQPEKYNQIEARTKISQEEMSDWKKVADALYFPYSEEHQVFLQQDGFLDKELITVSELDTFQRPINQKWSWDRILRSPYIKQADTLQGFYFFEDHFTQEELEKHFDFYEPFTVHESSLSPCVHSVLAAKLKRMDQAYEFYLRTSRLDLDDYNKEVEEGLHITSMAGTWMSIVEGFGGLRVKNDTLHFTPQIPEQWEAYSFNVNFRGQILKVSVCQDDTKFELQGDQGLQIIVNGSKKSIAPNSLITV